ncbi:MAG TPA: hypothetical protein VJ824_08605 [Bacillota bacterium]|nr:hypothetical protein [Bacillota bacterium]
MITNLCDEITVNIVRDLGEYRVCYSVLGDAGATYTKDQVKQALLYLSGSIVNMHMNKPSPLGSLQKV